MPSSSSSPLTRIPFIQKILYFTCIKVSDPIKYSHVSSSWRETLCSEEYGASVTIWSRKYNKNNNNGNNDNNLSFFPPRVSDEVTRAHGTAGHRAIEPPTHLDFTLLNDRNNPLRWHPSYKFISRLMTISIKHGDVSMFWVVRDLHKAGFPIHGPCLVTPNDCSSWSLKAMKPIHLSNDDGWKPPEESISEPLRFAACEGKVEIVKYLLQFASSGSSSSSASRYSPYHAWKGTDFVVSQVIYLMMKKIMQLPTSVSPKEDSDLNNWFAILDLLVVDFFSKNINNDDLNILMNFTNYSSVFTSAIATSQEEMDEQEFWSPLQWVLSLCSQETSVEWLFSFPDEKAESVIRICKLLISNGARYYGAAHLAQLVHSSSINSSPISCASTYFGEKILRWFFSMDFIRTMMKSDNNNVDDDDLKRRFLKQHPLFATDVYDTEFIDLHKKEDSIGNQLSYRVSHRWTQLKFFYIVAVQERGDKFPFVKKFIDCVIESESMKAGSENLIELDISNGRVPIVFHLVPTPSDWWEVTFDDENVSKNFGNQKPLQVEMIKLLITKANATTARKQRSQDVPLIHFAIASGSEDLCKFLILNCHYDIFGDKANVDECLGTAVEYADGLGWTDLSDNLKDWFVEILPFLRR